MLCSGGQIPDLGAELAFGRGGARRRINFPRNESGGRCGAAEADFQVDAGLAEWSAGTGLCGKVGRQREPTVTAAPLATTGKPAGKAEYPTRGLSEYLTEAWPIALVVIVPADAPAIFRA